MQHGRILKTAAGTGMVTRALVSSLPESVSIVATDLNQPMLDHAASQVPSTRVTWRQADAQHLPFSDSEFDVVVCHFGVMFFPDKRRAFSEAYRVLKPSGRFLFDVWNRIEENEFAEIAVKSVASLFPDNPPMFPARTPHGHYDTSALEAQLQAVGFRAVTTDIPDRLAEATDVAAAAIAEQFGLGPISGKIQPHIITVVRIS